MKKIKFAVCFFLLLFCLALNAELYQIHLDEFTGGVYCFNAVKMFDEEKEYVEKKREIVTRLSRENNCEVFCVDKKVRSSALTEIVIFTPDEKTAADVRKKLKVYPGEFKSLFSGVTNVEFRPIGEAPESMTFYFFGEEESIKYIKSNIGFNAGRLKMEKEKNVAWISVCAWLIFGVLLIILTRFDIQFQKKENLLTISLGKSTAEIILKNIFTDIAAVLCMAFVSCLILNKFIYLFFNKEISVLLFLSALFLNSSVYLLMLKFNLKAALSKSNFTETILKSSYILKTTSLSLTVVVFCLNLLIVTENSALFKQKENIEQFKDYSFISVYSENHYDTNNKTENLIAEIKADIFKRQSKKNSVAFCVAGITDSNTDYIIVNRNAATLLEGINKPETENFSEDCCIFIPDSYENKKEAISIINTELVKNKNATHKVVCYSENKRIMKIKDSARNDTVINFALSENPIILLCNFKKESLLDKTITQMSFGNMMFKLSEEDIAYYENKYRLNENMIEIKCTDTIERSEYAWSVLGRAIGLSTALCLIMLFLESVMIVTVSKLEHITRATENALKKILGYSIIKRNRNIFILNAISVLVGVVASVIVSLILESNLIYLILATGILFFVLECVVICLYVTKLEKTSVAKILKGGCL